MVFQSTFFFAECLPVYFCQRSAVIESISYQPYYIFTQAGFVVQSPSLLCVHENLSSHILVQCISIVSQNYVNYYFNPCRCLLEILHNPNLNVSPLTLSFYRKLLNFFSSTYYILSKKNNKLIIQNLSKFDFFFSKYTCSFIL